MTGDRSKLITMTLAIAIALFTRLLPVEYRLWNMTAVGALAIFAGARIGLWQSLVVTFSVMFFSDAVLFWQHDFNLHYAPFASIYTAMAAYALLGWLLLRKTENPLAIGGTALLGSAWFFLSTNFVSWLSPIHSYDRSIGGLLACYEAALPFYRGTFAGDLVYSGLFFATYAVLNRVLAPAPEGVTVES